jgi:selenocysteine-specific elongation factor
MKHVIVGTAGHIDHGKSSLVLALTGTDPDRLEEEKRRGITIDLGFAHLDLGDDLQLGFVDVPGHEHFIKNMLAGASGIDVVMLVVAADESIKPQTREHFDLCRLLGVQRGLIALTKIDLVDRDLVEIVRLEVQEFVAGSFLDAAPIVPVSARTGEGLDRLKEELRRLSLAVTPKSAERPFRLPIDRAFVMKGFGTVVTGTLIAGRVQREAELEVVPLGRRVRVRGIQVHNRPAGEARAGQRTALNLAGVEAKEITRGMVLADPDWFAATRQLDCVLTLLASARPLRHRARVHFHCGTAETVAEVALLDGGELKPGGRAYAQLRLTEPGLFLPGDRFIIRQFSPLATLGGGVILDSQPPRHRLGDARVRERLEVLERGDAEAAIELWVREAGELSIAALVARSGRRPSEVSGLAASLAAKGRLKPLGQPPNAWADSIVFSALVGALADQVDHFHQANPLLSGIAKEDLRGRLAGLLPAVSRDSGPHRPRRPLSTQLFNAVLDAAVAQHKVEVAGEVVRRAGRSIALTAEEAAAKQQISRAFEAAGLAVPSATEVLGALPVDRQRAEKILQILLRERVLVRVADNLIFHAAALDRLREALAQRKTQDKFIDVGAFKALTGVSRKYAIPLLEYLDRERVTRREGDRRIIL